VVNANVEEHDTRIKDPRKADSDDNRNTEEDGLVTRVYELEGAVMYEVAVPATPKTWSGSPYFSDWSESTLEFSENSNANSSDKLPK
jgi:hypothetical protein